MVYIPKSALYNKYVQLFAMVALLRMTGYFVYIRSQFYMILVIL